MESWEETYKFIGKLALALYTYGVEIHGETLQKILQDRGVYDGHEGGIAPLVAAASRYWASKDAAMSSAIASAFLGSEHTSPLEAPQEFATA
jgi:hypothetical protein